MTFEEALQTFKAKYIYAPRVIKIMENEFGLNDITVIYYDKYDKTPPLTITTYEGFLVEVRGVMPLKEGFEYVFDQAVLNDPNTWDTNHVPQMSEHYRAVNKMIVEYELGLL